MSRDEKAMQGLISLLIIYIPFGIICGFISAYVILGIIIIISLYILIVRLVCKIKFKKKYNIKHFPDGTSIALTRKKNSFIFKFPYWKYVNDPRNLVYQTSNTGLIYPESRLYLDGFRLKCENIIDFFNLIMVLKNKGVEFEENELEKIKIDKYFLYDFKQIINTFLDNKESNKNEFITFIADLLILNGLETVKMSKDLLEYCDLLYLSNNNEIGAIKCNLVDSFNIPLISTLSEFNSYAKNINVNNKIFISTTFFNPEAKKYAEKNNITLLDITDLEKLFNDVSIKPINNELEFKDIRKFIPEDLIKKLKNRSKLKVD